MGGIGISIAIIAVGAVLTFALEREAEGINLDTVGIIMMIMGTVGLVVSGLFWSNWGPYRRDRRGTTLREREVR
jgi:hypothetical protein